MNRLLWSLVVAVPVLGAAAAGTYFLQAQKPETATEPPAAAPTETMPASQQVGGGESQESPIMMKFAVQPKELSPAVKKGLEFLVKSQQEDGGWNQGGGWRVGNGGGGRVEGANVEDPSDIGNTCLALLALVRAGNTPTSGEYKDAVNKGLAFVTKRIEKCDTDSLYVTDVRNTQLQSKIGPYVDTFLANLLLAELKDKSGEQNKALVAALDKTMKKIVKHQGKDGNFAGNGGWAPVLSVGIANKSIARANLNGVQVDQVFFERAFAQSNASATRIAGSSDAAPRRESATTFTSSPPAKDAGFFASLGGRTARSSGGTGAGLGGFGGGGLGDYDLTRGSMKGFDVAGPGDAGVTLYSAGQGFSNSQDVVNSLRLDAKAAKDVLKDAKASQAAQESARKRLDEIGKAESENAKLQEALAERVRSERFVAGFGSNGGEEFLSFLNISETLILKGGKDWEDWDARMTKGLEKAQDPNGSWQGHHCITGRTFCTAGALLVLMADRTQFPPEVLADEKPEKKK